MKPGRNDMKNEFFEILSISKKKKKKIQVFSHFTESQTKSKHADSSFFKKATNQSSSSSSSAMYCLFVIENNRKYV